jgi:hypothetical protein
VQLRIRSAAKSTEMTLGQTLYLSRRMVRRKAIRNYSNVRQLGEDILKSTFGDKEGAFMK